MKFSIKYKSAQTLLAQGKYAEAAAKFEELGSYEEASKLAMYCKAAAAGEKGDYELAISTFRLLDDYKESRLMIVYYTARQLQASDSWSDWLSAAQTYDGIAMFRDSQQRAGTCRQAAKAAYDIAYKTAGSYVTFGHYPQTAGGNDSTPIEWLVLDYDAANNRALLLSRYGLDSKPYNTERTDITWEKCTLRSWLNGEFLKKAFSAAEQSAIETTTVDNSKSQGYSGWNTDGGKNTEDKVFLLSYLEANKYLNVEYWKVSGSDKDTKSRVSPTEYVKKQGAWTDSNNKTAEGAAAGLWWLRSPGYSQYSAAFVGAGGSLSFHIVSSGFESVRPALWINLNSEIF